MPRNVAQWNPQYHQIVLATDPIAYWLQDEKQGGVSYDWVRRRQGSDEDGAYTGVTLGQPGIGDGNTSPFFDGVNDFNNVFTPTFQGRFNGSEGSVMAWARVANAGVWTDGVRRTFTILFGNAANFISIRKANAPLSTIQWIYSSGGVSKNVILGAVATTGWFSVATTWSISAGVSGEFRAYFNGAQTGVTQTLLGAWPGAVTLATAVIGAQTIAPLALHYGNLAHAAVWNRPLTPAEVAALAVI